MRSSEYAALKIAVAEYVDDEAAFKELMADILTFGAQRRGDRGAFVTEVAVAVGQPIATVERWATGHSVAHPTIRKHFLETAFDRILADRP